MNDIFNLLMDGLDSSPDFFRGRAMDLDALRRRLAFDSFDPGPDADFAMGWGFLSHLSKGANRFAFNILKGTYHDEKLFIFDYHCDHISDNENEHLFYTIFMLLTRQYFPKITICPVNGLDKIEAEFDSRDIKFESADFSRMFRVRCEDKKFAYDVCNPQMIDHLLANPGLEIELQGPVISSSYRPPLPVGFIEAHLTQFAEIRALLPQYLFEQNPGT